MERIRIAFETSVPAAWRSAIPVRFSVVAGDTSRAWSDLRIEVASAHVNGSEALLRTVVAHEVGHLIAFRYGAQRPFGSAPEGFPAYSDRPEEAWADCVSHTFTGIDDPSHGLPSCRDGALSWARSWLGAGPAAHARTG
jgi:hypothetical protein